MSITARIVSLILFSFFSLSAIAQPLCQPYQCLSDGLYLGAGLGEGSYRIRQNVNVIGVSGSTDQANPALNLNNIQGRVLIGYGSYFDWFYLAGEATMAYSGANTNFSFNDYQSGLSVRTSYEVGILPGIRLTKASRVMARLGFVRTSIKSTESGALTGGASTSAWGNGIELGLGLETSIYKNVSLRGEYTYTSYGSFTSSLGTSYTPSNNQYMLDVIYYFAC